MADPHTPAQPNRAHCIGQPMGPHPSAFAPHCRINGGSHRPCCKSVTLANSLLWGGLLAMLTGLGPSTFFLLARDNIVPAVTLPKIEAPAHHNFATPHSTLP